MFKLLDWRGTGSLDDIQFNAFMIVATDLKERQIYKVFDIFDLDRSGSVEFDEDDQGKQFMYQHWRTCFEILDEDGGKTISMTEFSTLGFLFNFSPRAIKNIYAEFDITGNSELDYSEFRLFVLAAIEMQDKLDKGPETFPAKAIRALKKFVGLLTAPFQKPDHSLEAAANDIQMGSRMGLLGGGGGGAGGQHSNMGLADGQVGGKEGEKGYREADTGGLKEILVTKEMND
ncbi:EF-hand calcium-binding domain-containing protein 9 [Chytridiales sp. JEL 0842]|nr:EF-hand calcium-binding domain-containing protein 9 [Chytridiales sp. JEL 0842]